MLDVFHRSRSLSRPVYLYEIVFAEGEAGTLRLTTAGRTVTAFGQDFESAQVKHGNIESSGTLDNAALELNTPRHNPLVEVFRVYPPERVVSMTIFRGELDDPDADFKAIWSGRVLNFAMQGLEATFSCEPIATAVRRPGLRRTYQYGCPHVLYGPQCRADKAAASSPGTVAALDGSVVTLNAGWNAKDPPFYLRGMLEWTTDEGPVRRTILRTLSGDRLLLSGTLPGLAVGDSVTAVLGCSHRMDDCISLHNNVLNYGGQPWISKVNPLGPRTVFY